MLEDLSTDAKVMLGMWTLIPNTELTFQRPHIIDDRAAAGFKELENAALITKRVHDHGAWTYRPTKKLYEWWQGKTEDEHQQIYNAVNECNFPITDESKS